MVVDDVGGMVAFDPGSGAHQLREVVDAGNRLSAVACASVTDCVAVDGRGRALQGDPDAPSSWTIEPIVGADSLTAVACPAIDECVAVDDSGDETVGSREPHVLVRAQLIAAATELVRRALRSLRVEVT